MDKFSLDRFGVSVVPNHDVKQKLGFSDVQTFASDILDAASKVASTAIGDDCGEGTTNPAWANSRFASNMNSAIYFGSQFAQQTPWITALERARPGMGTFD